MTQIFKVLGECWWSAIWTRELVILSLKAAFLSPLVDSCVCANEPWQSHPNIVGGSCHMYHFCHGKYVFVMTDTCLSWQNTSFVTTKVYLSRQNFAVTNIILSRKMFCRDQLTFAATLYNNSFHVRNGGKEFILQVIVSQVFVVLFLERGILCLSITW